MKITFWWQNNEHLEFRSQCKVFEIYLMVLKCVFNDSEMLFNDLKYFVHDLEKLFNDFEMFF